MVIGSFAVFLLLFVLVGVLSARKRKETSMDYLLASHNVKPWLVALSAVATNNSGYMFVGQIGFTYVAGLSSIWLMIGWILGDFLMSFLVHKRLRTASEERNALSFAGVLSQWQGGDYKYVRLLGGIITLAFLSIYAAAQLNAGSKALHVLFGWDYAAGAIIGAVIVLLYCLASGIRASIWTDAAQSFVMIGAMGLMLAMSVSALGGWAHFLAQLDDVSPIYMNWLPQDLPLGGFAGPALFVLGWFFAGIGVIGQPHIMVRFMAMDDPARMRRTRMYYYSWYVLFYLMTIAVALAARILLPAADVFDAELALPSLAQQLLPPVFVGLVLAGLFAATMSTADSQILSCTAALTHDLSGGKLKNSYVANKVATAGVTLFALVVALSDNDSVFALIIFAWSGLAAAFAPLLIVLAFGCRVPQGLAVTMMLSGVSTAVAWQKMGYGDIIYEAAPGIVAGLLIFGAGKLLCSLRS
ncbi:MAG: sodium/proline symporter [Alphaproteobacteria bacterium]|nr:sodium/proline symporter [Alphaproteobacteria bacterium]